MSIRQNLFIAFEGLDGSGKTTQAQMLSERLRQDGHQVWNTFEPTSGPIGKMIRTIFKGEQSAEQHAIALLFAADRYEHIVGKEGLLHKKKQGYTIICDRYYLSSLAYHSVFCDMSWVMECNKPALELLTPDVHIFVDVPVVDCLQRMITNREELEPYETESNLRAVYNNYQQAFSMMGQEEQLLKVNGEGSPEEVHLLVNELLTAHFAL